MNARPGLDEIAQAFATAMVDLPGLAHGRAFVLHDLDRLDAHLDELRSLFPSNALHAVAIKANPVIGILRHIVDAGAGLEAASFEEVHLALAAGCPAERIVFDSPAKTDDELRSTLDRGVTVNVDNAVELQRALELAPNADARIGVRVRPDVAEGAIEMTSVGGRGSRFGLPADEARRSLPGAFRANRALGGLHVHVGSQGCSIDQLVDGVRVADELRRAIEAVAGPGRVRFLDIGGGLSTDYGPTESAPGFADYAARLREAAPDLFDGSVELITEFGRRVHSSCGVAISRIEHVKDVDGTRVVVNHLGADFLLRAAYRPEQWSHRFSVLDPEGRPRSGPLTRCTVAGPLCFAGDVIGREVALPPTEVGDWLVIHDVGAYTLSMWSRHCSRGIPPVIGISRDDAVLLHPGERPEDVVRFWGG